MPQKSAPELFAVVHYLHRLSTEGKRGAKMALESCPKCHFIMLEGVLMTIEEHGQNGTIYVSDLAAAVKQLHHQRDRRHTGCAGNGINRSFQRRNSLFQLVSGRVALTRIIMTGRFPNTRVGKSRRLVNRY